MKAKLIFVGRNQFGYLTDSYKWCEYLRQNFDITYVCFDYGRPRIDMQGVNVVYISRRLPEKLRGMLLLTRAIMLIVGRKTKVLVEYFPHCNIIKKALPWRRMWIDVRTMAVNQSPQLRAKLDAATIAECADFDGMSAISIGVAKMLKRRNVDILPLGSDSLSDKPKNYGDTIKMLYVGAFTGRNIPITVAGLSRFITRHPDVKVHYDIIGFGDQADVDAIKQAVEHYDLGDYVTMHGRLPHTELEPFFGEANLGVCFVPITGYFDHQPPTKTFEYAMSGIFTLATATQSNVEIVTPEIGVLIKDTAADFARGMEHYWDHRHELDEAKIRAGLAEYSWANICRNYLQPIINKI